MERAFFDLAKSAIWVYLSPLAMFLTLFATIPRGKTRARITTPRAPSISTGYLGQVPEPTMTSSSFSWMVYPTADSTIPPAMKVSLETGLILILVS